MRTRILIGALLFLGLIEATQNLLSPSAPSASRSLSEVLVLALPRWLLIIPGALLAARLSARFPLDREAWRRAVPIHLAASLVFAVTHLAACVVVYGFLIEGAPNRFTFRMRSLLTFYLALDLILYWGIIGASAAFHHARVAQERALAATRLSASLTEARLDALRAQLDPHFLFNTLNATSTMALRGDQRAVVEMLERLSELLRVSLDRNLPREIPLRQELEILERYLEIQAIRFGDRLTIEKTIDPESLTVLVPPMILQPLAENAFEHGISARPGPGWIHIRVERVNGGVRIEVEDSGPGWESEASPRNDGVVAVTGQAVGRGGGKGIGLSNTRERLECLYGTTYRFERTTGAAGGARVSLQLPGKIAGAQ